MPDKKFTNWSFGNEFNIPLSGMYILRTHPFITRNKVWLLQILSITGVNIVCLFLLCYSIFLHDGRKGNYADASKNFAILIICFNSNIKFYKMINCRKSISILIKAINRDYELAKHFNEEERNVILSYSKKGKKLCQIWIVIVFLASCIFPVKAFYLMLYYYMKGESRLVPMFDFTFPYFIERHKDTTLGFCGIFTLCFFFDTFAFFIYLSFEPLIPIFTLHTCGQLELLMVRMSKVIKDSRDEQEIKEKLKNINMILQELHIFMEHVQNNFRVIMEFNMKTTTFIIPCNGYQILEDFRASGIINIEFIALFLAANIHFLTPCIFCDMLMESSEKFRQSIYACGWENCRYVGVRNTVLLMLTRASKPFSVNTVFYFVCLDTYSTMCRQAYAIFNLMSAAWS